MKVNLVTKYEDSLPLQLIRARDIAMEYFRPVLAQNDLTEQQWRVMRVLDTKGEIDFTTLSRESCILSPSLTGIINRLEKLGYVEKKKCEHDGRKSFIHLTAKAEALVEKLRPQIEEQYVALKQRIGEDRYSQLSNLLNELIDSKH
ncbi:homoprotocatechuate degradation operon regulator HpaR [Vibrio hangzhouensis]|uniref:Homoprotocatechuate degradation operon regulator, HpaR n=1 Tax=Vibrio hangzhouensis TaxID=462991 RepID=A0A1H6AZ23_9VIBR|nr:homoprotocatechuate degradation operon regulator HpaR [Vibrio hangzhouensis]SEG53560.1 homoprotocatechuate degradation operon regulator, HpaR [Vibrio hangzhouensis]